MKQYPFLQRDVSSLTSYQRQETECAETGPHQDGSVDGGARRININGERE